MATFSRRVEWSYVSSRSEGRVTMDTSNSHAMGPARAGAIATSFALVVVPSFGSVHGAAASHSWTTATAQLAEHSVTVSAKAFPDFSGRWTLDTTALVSSQGTVHV